MISSFNKFLLNFIIISLLLFNNIAYYNRLLYHIMNHGEIHVLILSKIDVGLELMLKLILFTYNLSFLFVYPMFLALGMIDKLQIEKQKGSPFQSGVHRTNRHGLCFVLALVCPSLSSSFTMIFFQKLNI